MVNTTVMAKHLLARMVNSPISFSRRHLSTLHHNINHSMGSSTRQGLTYNSMDTQTNNTVDLVNHRMRQLHCLDCSQRRSLTKDPAHHSRLSVPHQILSHPRLSTNR